MKDHEGLWFKDQEAGHCCYLWVINNENYSWLLNSDYETSSCAGSASIRALYNSVSNHKYKRVGPVEVGKW